MFTLTMSLLCFWALNMSVVLLSMQDQKALGFHQKYLNLCYEDERRSYGFGMTWGWVINDRIFIFGWTIPLRPFHTKTNVCYGKFSAINILIWVNIIHSVFSDPTNIHMQSMQQIITLFPIALQRKWGNQLELRFWSHAAVVTCNYFTIWWYSMNFYHLLHTKMYHF